MVFPVQYLQNITNSRLKWRHHFTFLSKTSVVSAAYKINPKLAFKVFHDLALTCIINLCLLKLPHTNSQVQPSSPFQSPLNMSWLFLYPYGFPAIALSNPLRNVTSPTAQPLCWPSYSVFKAQFNSHFFCDHSSPKLSFLPLIPRALLYCFALLYVWGFFLQLN